MLCGAKILLLTDLPERKKPCAIENSAQCPLNFFIADVESRAQITVVLRKFETLVKDCCHPSCFETLKPDKERPRKVSVEKLSSYFA